MAVLAIAIGFSASGQVFRSAEDGLRTVLSPLRSAPASGQLHLVEMDAASMSKYRQWPWPREHYATVIDRLNEVGVRSIAFDVDFSAQSNAASDEALANAIARSEAEVVLPTFSQKARFGDMLGERRMLDALPIASIRENATLGSVSMLPDDDGIVREMPLGTVTQGIPRPSLAANLAKRSGTVGQAFPIDTAIDAATIPRHSFVAVEQGRFDREALAGKDVLIGATAIEVYDRYPVPGYGVIPGVVLQALAVETLYRGIPQDWGIVPLLLVAVFAGFWLLSASWHGQTWLRAGAVAVALIVGPVLVMGVYSVQLAAIPALVLTLAIAITQTAKIARHAQMRDRLRDVETGLPNARALNESMARKPGRFIVAAMIDEFDTLRAVLGPEALADAINRLGDRLSIAGSSLELYRIDERVLAWRTDDELYELEDQLAGLRAIMRSPLEVAGKRLDINLYFGIAEAPDVAGAVHAASQALRQKEQWRYHEDAQSAALAQQISLMGELDEGVETGQLQVFYQPKLDLATNRIASAEALVRWEHPTRGFLRPDVFIPLAEENDRIADLTLFVLRRTIDDLRDWCTKGLVIGAAVNISAKLITDMAFTERARTILADSGIPRDRLTFEITESAEMDDPQAAREALLEFRKMGVLISMDDYGTGQSTLSYIKNLPLSELKIDRSFVQFAHTNSGDAMLVRSTVQLAHELGLSVVAEGVEDAECLAFLRSIACDYAQGYLIGKPMTIDDLEPMLSDGLDDAA